MFWITFVMLHRRCLRSVIPEEYRKKETTNKRSSTKLGEFGTKHMTRIQLAKLKVSKHEKPDTHLVCIHQCRAEINTISCRNEMKFVLSSFVFRNQSKENTKLFTLDCRSYSASSTLSSSSLTSSKTILHPFLLSK